MAECTCVNPFYEIPVQSQSRKGMVQRQAHDFCPFMFVLIIFSRIYTPLLLYKALCDKPVIKKALSLNQSHCY